MLAAYCSTNNESSCAKLLGTATPQHEGGLISNNTSLISANPAGGGLDSCSFYSGPTDATIFAFGESGEACGSIAYSSSGETAGSIAYSGGETAGSIAYSAGSSCGGFSGGCCSYSC